MKELRRSQFPAGVDKRYSGMIKENVVLPLSLTLNELG